VENVDMAQEILSAFHSEKPELVVPAADPEEYRAALAEFAELFVQKMYKTLMQLYGYSLTQTSSTTPNSTRRCGATRTSTG